MTNYNATSLASFPYPSSSSSPVDPLNFLDPSMFLYSCYACALGFTIVALRAIVWGSRYCEYHRINASAYLSEKVNPPSFAPLFLSFLLMIVLALRSAWSYVMYISLINSNITISPKLLTLLDHIPLLFLLSAFSRISLFWVRSFGMEKTNRISLIVFGANLLLYISCISQLILSFWYPDVLNPHNMYYIVQLCAVALWCLILSTLFSVYGWKLRYRLQKSIHVTKHIRNTFNRILAATICCTGLFLLRGILFCYLTIQYNVFNELDPKANHIIYPLFVYTIPDVVSSICILFIMNVKKDERASNNNNNETNTSSSSSYLYNNANNTATSTTIDTRQNYGGVGSLVDHRNGYSSTFNLDTNNQNNTGYYSPTRLNRDTNRSVVGEGEAAFLDEQSPTDTDNSLKYDWEQQNQGYNPPQRT